MARMFAGRPKYFSEDHYLSNTLLAEHSSGEMNLSVARFRVSVRRCVSWHDIVWGRGSFFRGFLYYEPQNVIMKKLSIFIAGFATLLFSVSAFADKRQEASIGNVAPGLVLSNSDSVVSLESLKGKWVILSFWSSSDAVSRLARNEVKRFTDTLPEETMAERIEIVSVNFDRSEQLMNEIIRLDNLDGAAQFHISDPEEESELRKSFRMAGGLRTFIINPEGVLVAADPSYEKLRNIVGWG
ncbi:MAG: peroxiredoxin family protein [Muribaculaceae bacterium]|nr:peroxiredoxin family protein [Muribaculaceae bacterium]